jgi:hypothetical protein
VGTAGLRALHLDAGRGGLNPLAGLVLFQGLQGLAVLLGGLLAGAGQARGSLLGGFVGLLSGTAALAGMLSGAVSTLVQSYSAELLTPGTPTHQVVMYGLLAQQLVVGAVGGFLGSFVWRPLVVPVDSRYAALARRRPARRDPGEPAFRRWSGPVAWVRVLTGTGLAAVGAHYTPDIVDFILQVSDRRLQLMTQLENQVAFGEVFGLCILLGGCWAGATRVNGLKQGACVGLLVAGIMAGSFLKAVAAFTPSVLFPVLSALLLGPVGGWFGSELLPPVGKARFRQRK